MRVCACEPVHVQERGTQKQRRVRVAGPELQRLLLPRRALASVWPVRVRTGSCLLGCTSPCVHARVWEAMQRQRRPWAFVSSGSLCPSASAQRPAAQPRGAGRPSLAHTGASATSPCPASHARPRAFSAAAGSLAGRQLQPRPALGCGGGVAGGGGENGLWTDGWRMDGGRPACCLKHPPPRQELSPTFPGSPCDEGSVAKGPPEGWGSVGPSEHRAGVERGR